jgi:hypothetical protein
VLAQCVNLRERFQAKFWSAQFVNMRRARNELVNLHINNEMKKINLFGFVAQIFGSK